MSELRLTDVEWEEFLIGGDEGIFSVEGTITTPPSKLIKNGPTPRVTCASTNNAIDDFYQNLPTEKGGVLVVDSATEGFVSYQSSDFIATDHVEKIALKSGEKISRNIGIFLKTAINISVNQKYNYGYKFNQTRIKRQKIKLPIDSLGQPNWQFMEDYIKQEQKKQVLQLQKYYESKFYQLAGDLVGLEEVEWKEFRFTDIFTTVQRGKRLAKHQHVAGEKPYVSSTAMNNGVDGFIGNNEKVREFENCLTVANSGSVGASFYHRYKFIASDHVTALKNEQFCKEVYLFLSTMIKRLEQKYSFNREINDNRISREKLLLPTDKNGQPNWQYMSDFVKKMELDKIEKILSNIYIYI
ncbi:restriction endonuclease subunit S [Streptococcus cuniculi]|uniref:restriction endonuclease subunit S n=1 Tax=Streptococcus cuniculi TaxID=1432788 RepID=UPI001D1693ED|nr:restriction endonuclease subunit S [Streptococcus cuniculi]